MKPLMTDGNGNLVTNSLSANECAQDLHKLSTRCLDQCLRLCMKVSTGQEVCLKGQVRCRAKTVRHTLLETLSFFILPEVLLASLNRRDMADQATRTLAHLLICRVWTIPRKKLATGVIRTNSGWMPRSSRSTLAQAIVGNRTC